MMDLTSQINVSVIIPVYNGELYLGEAIESVISQSLRPSEIIVIDDGSTDRSKLIAKKYSEVHYFYQTNKGTASSRNLGINKSKGNFLAFLDQDDTWETKKLELQINAFQKNKNLDIVFGHLQQFYSPELQEEIKMKIYCPGHPEPGYLPSAMLIKRDSFFEVGMFETKWKIGEWTNWFVRATEIGLKTEMLSDILVRRRIHNENKGILKRDERTEYVQILKASLDRRRAKGKV
jgi:glycosyltransferase involved in cell wall biosynthesis